MVQWLTFCSQCRECGFNPRSGSKDPTSPTKPCQPCQILINPQSLKFIQSTAETKVLSKAFSELTAGRLPSWLVPVGGREAIPGADCRQETMGRPEEPPCSPYICVS